MAVEAGSARECREQPQKATSAWPICCSETGTPRHPPSLQVLSELKNVPVTWDRHLTQTFHPTQVSKTLSKEVCYSCAVSGRTGSPTAGRGSRRGGCSSPRSWGSCRTTQEGEKPPGCWRLNTPLPTFPHRHTYNVTPRKRRHRGGRRAGREQLGAGQRQGQALAVGGLRVSALGLVPVAHTYSLFYLTSVVCGGNTAELSHFLRGQTRTPHQTASGHRCHEP